MADGGASAQPSHLRMQQKILQSDGRRYSLRLEGCYWAALTRIAARRGRRLNRLVADIAIGTDGASLASRLRAYCLAESERAALRLETPAERTSIVTLIETAPAPALAVNAVGRIAVVNALLLDWIGLASDALVDTPLLRHFRFHARAGLNVEMLWKDCERRSGTVECARMIHIAPGRVLAANVRLVPVKPARGRSLCLLWIAK